MTLHSEFIWMHLNSFTIYWLTWWTNAFYTLKTHILTSDFIAVKIEKKNNFRLPFWKMKLELNCKSLPVHYDHVFMMSASRKVRKVWTSHLHSHMYQLSVVWRRIPPQNWNALARQQQGTRKVNWRCNLNRTFSYFSLCEDQSLFWPCELGRNHGSVIVRSLSSHV